MVWYSKIWENVRAAFQNGTNFLLLMYVMMFLTWGIGGLLGQAFVLAPMNYLLIFPVNILILGSALIGAAGIGLASYPIKRIFGLLNVFIFASISINLVRYTLFAISTNTYIILTFFSILLLGKIEVDRRAKNRRNTFLK